MLYIAMWLHNSSRTESFVQSFIGHKEIHICQLTLIQNCCFKNSNLQLHYSNIGKVSKAMLKIF